MTDPRQRQELGVLLFVANRALEQRAFDAVVAAGITDITLAQARIAARIAADGSRVTELAERARVTKQSAASLVEQLEKAGYVERVPDPTDARARLIRISQRGKEAQACAREMEQRLEAEFEAHLGPRRMRELRRSLESLREITDPYA